MRLTLIPAAMELIKFIPVPAIEYSDREFDVAVENVVLPGDTLLPGFVEVKVTKALLIDAYNNMDTHMMISLRHRWITISSLAHTATSPMLISNHSGSK